MKITIDLDRLFEELRACLPCLPGQWTTGRNTLPRPGRLTIWIVIANANKTTDDRASYLALITVLLAELIGWERVFSTMFETRRPGAAAMLACL
jgi:hypothetical protein